MDTKNNEVGVPSKEPVLNNGDFRRPVPRHDLVKAMQMIEKEYVLFQEPLELKDLSINYEEDIDWVPLAETVSLLSDFSKPFTPTPIIPLFKNSRAGQVDPP
jgi:hypothetical protein